MQPNSDPILYGNLEDKSNLANPISRWLVDGFDRALFRLLRNVGPASIHEVGCGEGRLLRKMAATFSVPMRGTELSSDLVTIMKKDPTLGSIRVAAASIYDLRLEQDVADTIVCCEVLEHLDDPKRGLAALRELGARAYILSVPDEPLWCILNLLRGKYWGSAGNTPGHLQHWSCRKFIRLLGACGFSVETIRRPIPWSMVLAHIA